MGDKAQGSRPVTPMPQLWNRVVDSMTRHEQQLRLGKGKPPKPFAIDKNIVKCKNNVGTNLTRGSVVDVGDYLLTGLSSYEPATLWFNGDEPAGGHYAVFRGDVPDDEYGDAQLTGVCIARVDVVDEDHTFAVPTDGETYFTSAAEGEIQILDKASSGTGVKECVVVLRCGGGSSTLIGFGIPTDTILGCSGDDFSDEVFHSGTIDMLRIVSGEFTDTPTPDPESVTAYNMSVFDIDPDLDGNVVEVWQDFNGTYYCKPFWRNLVYANGYAKHVIPLTVASGTITGSQNIGLTCTPGTAGFFANEAATPDAVEILRSCQVKFTIRLRVQRSSGSGTLAFTLQKNSTGFGFGSLADPSSVYDVTINEHASLITGHIIAFDTAGGISSPFPQYRLAVSVSGTVNFSLSGDGSIEVLTD